MKVQKLEDKEPLNLTTPHIMDYRGEVGVPVVNLNPEPIWIEAGERICQAVFNEITRVTWKEVDTLNETERGEGGFNSTGSK